jgi:hypothetical protein
MRLATIGVMVSSLVLSTSFGCAMQQKKTMKEVTSDAPINCSTAEGDIRVLKGEKAHVAEQVAEGVTAIFPAGLVLGILTGTEGTKIKVAVGEYDKAIDKHIALIQSTCGVQ